MMNSPIVYGHMWGAPWFYSYGAGPAILFGIIAIALVIALIALKGYALWSAVKRDEKWWFIAILIFNTVGILEAVYIIFFVKGWHKKRAHHTADHAEHHDHPHHPAQ